MLFGLMILREIVEIAGNCPDGAGRVTPKQVRHSLAEKGFKISDYKVAQVFKEAKEDMIITFHANHYKYNCENQLMFSMIDTSRKLIG